MFDGEPDGVKPDATLTMTDQTFMALVEKKTMPQTVSSLEIHRCSFASGTTICHVQG